MSVALPNPPFPPSAGAHRLAWWIAGADARVVPLCLLLGPAMLDRLLSGAVDPAEPQADAIAELTDGAVRFFDWSTPATAGWFDAPAARAA